MAKTLLPLVIGAVLFFMGVSATEFALVNFTESIPSEMDIPDGILLVLLGFAIISLALGVLFLVVHFRVRRNAAELYLPESSTTLALNVAVEFLLGAWLAVVGVDNFDADAGSEGLPWSLASIVVIGLLLVIDSVLLYRNNFKQGIGKKKGV